MSSKLALPPLTGMPPDVQAAFRAVAAWARSSESVTVGDQKTALVQVPQLQRVVTPSPGARPASSIGAYAPEVPTIKNESIIRSIFSNSALVEPIQLNASVVFQSGTSTTGVGIGAGGIIGKNNAYAYPGYEGYTFGITAEDGSFFFGPQVDDPDPARKQIIFDVGTGVFQFGKDIIVKTSSGDKTLDTIASSAGYDSTDLQADLAAGVGAVLAGQGGDYRLHVDTTGAKVVLYHKDAVFKGTAAAGSNKPALGITAAGIAMGYNRLSDGAWVDSVAIDSSGNASFAGTVSANSIISVSATCNGTSMGTVVSNAANGASAYSSLSNKLDKNASYVMGASSEFQTSGYAGGNGMMFSNNGIIARSGGANKFVIASNGDATFYGTLSAATGSFAGNVSTTGTVSATGTISGVNACIYANPAASGVHGVVGYGTGGLYGIYGITNATGSGSGVCGEKSTANGSAVRGAATGSGAVGVSGTSSLSHGVQGTTSSASGAGVAGSNGASGPAIYAAGIFTWGSYNISAPNGSSTNYLRADGTWAAPTVSNADTVDGYHAASFPILAGTYESGSFSATYRIPATWNGVNIWVLAQAR